MDSSQDQFDSNHSYSDSQLAIPIKRTLKIEEQSGTLTTDDVQKLIRLAKENNVNIRRVEFLDKREKENQPTTETVLERPSPVVRDSQKENLRKQDFHKQDFRKQETQPTKIKGSVVAHVEKWLEELKEKTEFKLKKSRDCKATKDSPNCIDEHHKSSVVRENKEPIVKTAQVYEVDEMFLPWETIEKARMQANVALQQEDSDVLLSSTPDIKIEHGPCKYSPPLKTSMRNKNDDTAYSNSGTRLYNRSINVLMPSNAEEEDEFENRQNFLAVRSQSSFDIQHNPGNVSNHTSDSFHNTRSDVEDQEYEEELTQQLHDEGFHQTVKYEYGSPATESNECSYDPPSTSKKINKGSYKCSNIDRRSNSCILPHTVHRKASSNQTSSDQTIAKVQKNYYNPTATKHAQKLFNPADTKYSIASNDSPIRLPEDMNSNHATRKLEESSNDRPIIKYKEKPYNQDNSIYKRYSYDTVTKHEKNHRRGSYDPEKTDRQTQRHYDQSNTMRSTGLHDPPITKPEKMRKKGVSIGKTKENSYDRPTTYPETGFYDSPNTKHIRISHDTPSSKPIGIHRKGAFDLPISKPEGRSNDNRGSTEPTTTKTSKRHKNDLYDPAIKSRETSQDRQIIKPERISNDGPTTKSVLRSNDEANKMQMLHPITWAKESSKPTQRSNDHKSDSPHPASEEPKEKQHRKVLYDSPITKPRETSNDPRYQQFENDNKKSSNYTKSTKPKESYADPMISKPNHRSHNPPIKKPKEALNDPYAKMTHNLGVTEPRDPSTKQLKQTSHDPRISELNERFSNSTANGPLTSQRRQSTYDSSITEAKKYAESASNKGGSDDLKQKQDIHKEKLAKKSYEAGLIRKYEPTATNNVEVEKENRHFDDTTYGQGHRKVQRPMVDEIIESASATAQNSNNYIQSVASRYYAVYAPSRKADDSKENSSKNMEYEYDHSQPMEEKSSIYSQDNHSDSMSESKSFCKTYTVSNDGSCKSEDYENSNESQTRREPLESDMDPDSESSIVSGSVSNHKNDDQETKISHRSSFSQAQLQASGKARSARSLSAEFQSSDESATLNHVLSRNKEIASRVQEIEESVSESQAENYVKANVLAQLEHAKTSIRKFDKYLLHQMRIPKQETDTMNTLQAFRSRIERLSKEIDKLGDCMKFTNDLQTIKVAQIDGIAKEVSKLERFINATKIMVDNSVEKDKSSEALQKKNQEVRKIKKPNHLKEEHSLKKLIQMREHLSQNFPIREVQLDRDERRLKKTMNDRNLKKHLSTAKSSEECEQNDRIPKSSKECEQNVYRNQSSSKQNADRNPRSSNQSEKNADRKPKFSNQNEQNADRIPRSFNKTEKNSDRYPRFSNQSEHTANVSKPIEKFNVKQHKSDECYQEIKEIRNKSGSTCYLFKKAPTGNDSEKITHNTKPITKPGSPSSKPQKEGSKPASSRQQPHLIQQPQIATYNVATRRAITKPTHSLHKPGKESFTRAKPSVTIHKPDRESFKRAKPSVTIHRPGRQSFSHAIPPISITNPRRESVTVIQDALFFDRPQSSNDFRAHIYTSKQTATASATRSPTRRLPQKKTSNIRSCDAPKQTTTKPKQLKKKKDKDGNGATLRKLLSIPKAATYNLKEYVTTLKSMAKEVGGKKGKIKDIDIGMCPLVSYPKQNVYVKSKQQESYDSSTSVLKNHRACQYCMSGNLPQNPQLDAVREKESESESEYDEYSSSSDE